MTIAVMQNQIGMLCEMMGDANSKMDSMLRLQRSMLADARAGARRQTPVLLASRPLYLLGLGVRVRD